MIKVELDHQIFSMQKFGGISRYFAALSAYLEASPYFDHRLKVIYSRNAYLSKKHSILPAWAGNLLLKNESDYYRYNKKYFKGVASLNNFDIYHPTYYHPYFLKRVKKPVVITVHDMIHELYPSFFPNDRTSHNKEQVLARADHIIAISQTTKDDLKQILNVPDERISVVHHGYFKPVIATPQLSARFRPRSPYLLFVGSRGGYKNFHNMVEAIVPTLKHQPELSVVCAGGGKFNSEERLALEKYDVFDRFLQLDATEFELAELYKNALVFIFPSLYEGFGLPILEAFHHGCPVAISRTKCFLEVAGDAASYFDPDDLESIHKSITEMVNDERLRKTLMDQGKSRLLRFSAESCMEKTAEVYKMLAGV